jgi:hypothetical protein
MIFGIFSFAEEIFFGTTQAAAVSATITKRSSSLA